MSITHARRTSLALGLSLLLGCAEPRAEERHELDDLARRHAQEMDALRSAESDFARRNPMPRTIEFHDAGSVIVRECALQGILGEEFLRLQFTWINSTNHDIDGVRITIVVRDPRANAEEVREIDLLPPLRNHFGPDCSYTTCAEVPTRGIHANPEWDWRLEARAIERAAAPTSATNAR